MNNAKPDLTFNDCKTLEEIKARQKETNSAMWQVPFSKIPAWYLYGYNSADQLEIYLRQRMQLIHIFVPGYIKDLSDLSLYIS